MDFSTKQNLEWNMGGVNRNRAEKKRKRLKHSSLLLYFYFIALAPGLRSYSPSSIHWNCVQRFPLVSFVNMGPGSVYKKMAHMQNQSSVGLFPCSFKYCSIPSSPFLTLSLSGVLTAVTVKSNVAYAEDRLILPQVKRGGEENRRSVDPPATDYPPS